MDLRELIIGIGILAVIWVVVSNLIPMPAPAKQVFNIIIAILMILIMIDAVGLEHSAPLRI